MPDPVQPKSRPRRRRSTTGWISSGAAALLPVLACFLGGATEKWAEGVVVATLGLFLLARPPRFSFGLATNCVMAAFVALAGFAFLPAGWFFGPEWRWVLINDFGIQLPQTVSAQPWISGTCLISLVAGIAWLYFIGTQETDLRSVCFQLRLFVVGIVFLAAMSIAIFLAHIQLSFWINQRNFGPFPNRNQTADLFGIASVILLACGLDDLRHGRKRWVLSVIGLGILMVAIILNFSRAGIVILIGGNALWITVVALRQRSTALIALGFSFLLLLLTAILLLGGQTLERFHLRGFGGTGITTDFRWKIFHDTFDLIRQSPWCGLGLGNFDPVFALFRKESFTSARALHPESDWLWMWVEMGWPAVVLALAGAALLLRHVFPLQEGTNQRFRLAALIGAIIFAVHGLVDVSGHRVGTAYAGIFLLGLCLHRPFRFQASRVAPVFFRLLGLALLASGLSWTVAAQNKALLPGSVGVSNVKQLAPPAIRGRSFSEAISLTTQALHWAPLDWELYFSRALGEIGAKQPEKALDDFRRARYLEPNTYEVPLAEGSAWLASQPVYAATAWREALRRTKTGQQRLEVYGGMLNQAAMRSPEVGHILQEVGLSEHDLVLAYLSRVSGKLFTQELERFLKNDLDLHTLTETEKLALFTLWSERGDLEDLARQVQQHRDWIQYAWLGLAKYSASKNDFRAAYELTQRFGEPVAMPRISGEGSLEELQNRYYANADNYAAGYALYREQIKRGRIDDALLTARHFSERPKAPAYFHYLEAQAWVEKQNWERAWAAWTGYYNATKK
jgi:O-antigen ligase